MDLEVLKDIPGYKAILKSVLKSQILLLIEQLSEHTGEETIILTASLHDGTLSHLGSSTGKGFLEGRDEIKSQFLGYCLKSQHKKKTSEARSSPYQRPTSDQGISQKRPRTQTLPLRHAGMGADAFSPPEMLRAPSLTTNGQTDSSANVKQETSEQNTSKKKNNSFVTESVSFPLSLQLSHTQTSADDSCDTSEHPANNTNEYPEQESENDDNTATSIKIEPITENEMELEITGIEPGKSSNDPEIWGQGHSASASTCSVGDPAAGNEGDQSGYKNPSQTYQPLQLLHYPPTTNCESLIFLQPVKLQDSAVITPTDQKTTSSQDLTTQPSFTKMLSSIDYGYQQPTGSADCSNTDNTRKTQISPSSSTYRQYTSVTPIPLSGNQKIVIPACPDDQTLPFTKENYGKEKDKWVLKRHICQYCGKRCLKPSDLTRHVKTHTGEYSYECPHCGKRFREKYQLNLHFSKGHCEA